LKKTLLYLLFITAVTVIIYCPSVSDQFMWDDHTIIVGNPALRASSPIQFFAQTYIPPTHTLDTPPYYRPMIIIWFWIQYNVWGLNAFGFRLFNIAFYLAIILVFFAFCKKCFKNSEPALLATAIFAFLPFHLESVAFISGLTDISAILFIILSIIAFDSEKKWAQFVIAPVLFAFALFSKETAVAGFLLFPIWLFWLKKKSLKESILHSLPFLVPLAAYFSLRFWVLGYSSSGIPENILEKILMAPYILLRYIQLMVFPIDSSPLHNETFQTFPLIFWILWIVILVTLAVFCVRFLKDRKIWFGIIWVLLFIAPALGIVISLGPSRPDRFAFIPSAGSSLILGYYLCIFFSKRLFRSRRITKLLGFSYLLMLVLITASYSSWWNNGWNLYEKMIIDVPKSPIGYAGIARKFHAIGEYDSSLVYLELALERDSLHIPSLMSINKVLIISGRYGEISKYSEKMIRRYPNYSIGYLASGYTNLWHGDTAKAVAMVVKATETVPFDPWTWLDAGEFFVMCGDTSKAIFFFNRAAQLLPDNKYIANRAEIVRHSLDDGR